MNFMNILRLVYKLFTYKFQIAFVLKEFKESGNGNYLSIEKERLKKYNQFLQKTYRK